MATTSTARLHLVALADVQKTGATGALQYKLENVVGGRGWRSGDASGKVDQVYFRDRDALGAGATDNYNLLAAGALTDPEGTAIDMDELAFLAIVVDSGSIRIDAPAANAIGIFTDATDLINLTSTTARAVYFDFGAAGMDVTTNASFDITETSGAATADYRILAVGRG